MKIAIIGSRSFNDYNYMEWRLDCLGAEFGDFGVVWDGIHEVVSGGARGADTLAGTYADRRMLKLTVYPADWDKYGKSAGFRRNKQIVDYADIVVAFWDGESKGTKHSIDLAVKQNKSVFIYTDWKGNDV